MAAAITPTERAITRLTTSYLRFHHHLDHHASVSEKVAEELQDMVRLLERKNRALIDQRRYEARVADLEKATARHRGLSFAAVSNSTSLLDARMAVKRVEETIRQIDRDMESARTSFVANNEEFKKSKREFNRRMRNFRSTAAEHAHVLQSQKLVLINPAEVLALELMHRKRGFNGEWEMNTKGTGRSITTMNVAANLAKFPGRSVSY